MTVRRVAQAEMEEKLPGLLAREAMTKRWSPSRTSVAVMCLTTQSSNQPYAR